MKTGDRETEDAGTPKDDDTSPGRDENVIRLPREWIGPLEELVPIRPAPAPEAVGDQADPIDGEIPPGADAFWSEDAGVLHNAVCAPVESSLGATEHGRGSVERRAGIRLALAGMADVRSRWDRVRLRQIGVAAVAVPLVALALIGTLWGSSGGRTPAVAGRHQPTPGQASAAHALGAVSVTRKAQATGARRHLKRGATPARRRAAGRRAHAETTAAKSRAGRAVTARRTSSPSTSGAIPVGSSTTYSPPPPATTTGNGTLSTPSTVSSAPTAGSASTGGARSSGGTTAFGPSGALGPGSSPSS